MTHLGGRGDGAQRSPLNQAARTRVARRRNEAGFEEIIGFAGEPGSARFTVRYAPTGPSRGTVVICPAVLADYIRNYHRDVALARSLAAFGFAVTRFDYLGTGNSDGSPAETTFDGMVEDAVAACQDAEDELILVGARFGAIIAATAATTRRAANLVLVEPVIEPRHYFREGFRAALTKRLRGGATTSSSSAQLVDEISANGVVDLLGHSLYRAFYESADGHSLVDAMSSANARALWVQFGTRGGLRRTSSDAIAAANAEIDVELVGDQLRWWFASDSETLHDQCAAVVTGWVNEQCASRAVR